MLNPLDSSRCVPIAVVIPVHNAARTIEETLASVFCQTVQPLEVIVVDDGSTDDTATIARKAGATVYEQSNRGVSAARNAGAARASALWIAYLDGDDLWAPDKLERQYAATLCEPESKVVFTDFWEFDAQQVLNRSVVHECLRGFAAVRRVESGPNAWRCDSSDLCDLMPRQFVMMPSTLMVQRDFVLSLGGWDEGIALSEDIELALRMLARTTALFVDVPLVGYRRHSGNVTANRLRMRNGDISVLERVFANETHYLPSAVAWFRREEPTILLKGGRMAVVYGEHVLGRSRLRASWRGKKGVAAVAWLMLSYMSDNAVGRQAFRSLEHAWFAYRIYRTRSA